MQRWKTRFEHEGYEGLFDRVMHFGLTCTSNRNKLRPRFPLFFYI
jgi:hypothetical protein